jgi:putative phosphoribosyl transferase
MIYADRKDAGRVLAEKLKRYSNRHDVQILALPRGGVPVAFEIARKLNVPLDVYVVRKLGTPGHRELAMGAIASGGVRIMNPEVVFSLGIPDYAIEKVAREEGEELLRREREFRGDAPALSLKDKIVILVDDGLATGASMRAAIMAVKLMHPKKIVVAVPVAAKQTYKTVQRECDETICGETPDDFEGVGQWYENFDQTSDEEVRTLLAQARGQNHFVA